MSIEKIHEHKSHAHHKKNDEGSYTIGKVQLWQGVSAVLAVIIVVMWFSGGGAHMGAMPTQGGAAVPTPTAAPSPSPSPSPTPTEQQRFDVSVDDDAMKGDPDAPVTIIEFSDFECPFCARFYSQTLPSIQKDYIDTGKVKLVYRDFPLSFHPNAAKAGEAAECAKDQDKFWEMHDWIFDQTLARQSIASDALKAGAAELGLDTDAFNSCLDSGEKAAEVQADFVAGQAAGVTGTPSFFINGVRLVGAHPFPSFKEIIDAELAK